MMPMQGQQQAPQGQPDPKQVEAKLVQVLQQAAKLAQENGLNFEDIVAKVLGGGKPSAPPMPMG
jgi:hypothetical protein